MMTPSGKVLIVAAHPDDEVLGCGGTIARMVQSGREVDVAILGEGVTSRLGSGTDSDRKMIESLRETCRQAAEILGVTDCVFYDYPDNRFDTVPLLEIVKTVEELIHTIQPEIVYTHHPGDLNIDHSITFRAVMTATRPLESGLVRKVYSFEVPSSTDWIFGGTSERFEPNEFVDICSTLDVKINAMKCYTSELKEYPHPRSLRSIESQAAIWGHKSACNAAEAFTLVREIL